MHAKSFVACAPQEGSNVPPTRSTASPPPATRTASPPPPGAAPLCFLDTVIRGSGGEAHLSGGAESSIEYQAIATVHKPPGGGRTLEAAIRSLLTAWR